MGAGSPFYGKCSFYGRKGPRSHVCRPWLTSPAGGRSWSVTCSEAATVLAYLGVGLRAGNAPAGASGNGMARTAGNHAGGWGSPARFSWGWVVHPPCCTARHLHYVATLAYPWPATSWLGLLWRRHTPALEGWLPQIPPLPVQTWILPPSCNLPRARG